jgi:alkylated DNA repair protein (DNA oxidative demethylase)
VERSHAREAIPGTGEPGYGPFRVEFGPYIRDVSAASVTNCGRVSWVSDRSGYRYDPTDPVTGAPWPAMPAQFLSLARRAAALLLGCRFK